MNNGIVIAPGPKEDLETSIANLQKYDDLKHLLDEETRDFIGSTGKEEFGIWAVSDELSERGFLRRIEKGDFIIFYESKDEQKFRYSGKIVTWARCPEITREVWPNADGDSSPWVYFIDEIKEIDVSLKTFIDKIGYREGYIPEQFLKVRESLEKKLIKEHGNINAVMQFLVTDNAFELEQSDFDICKAAYKDPKKEIIKSVHDKFENKLKPQLIRELGNELDNFIDETKNHVTPYVATIHMQGAKKGTKALHKDGMWIGFAHKRYTDPRDGIQLQFGINYSGVFSFGIWIDEVVAVSCRKEIFDNANKQLSNLLRLLKSLDEEYCIGDNDKNYVHLDDKFDQKSLKNILDDLKNNRDVSFEIRKVISIEKVIDRGTNIVNDIGSTFKKLLPIYDILAGTQKYIPEPDTENHILEKLGEDKKLKRIIFSHLMAGKNVILYGPPGTGKTRTAKEIAGDYNKKWYLRTANAEWTVYDVIGGRTIGDKMKTEFELGFLSKAAKEKKWLIIDELNRANLDLAFGEAFTLLDVEHRKNVSLLDKKYAQIKEEENDNTNSSRDVALESIRETMGDKSTEKSKKDDCGTGELRLPQDFRLLATLNNYDRAILFSLGYAFRRRFAFIEIPSPFKNKDDLYDQSKDKNTIEGGTSDG